MQDWPISPTFLSLKDDCTEETANYNEDGIFYTDYLRGFLADLSHDKRIENALSLFQFVPEDFIPNDPNARSNPREGTVLLNTPNEQIEQLLTKKKKKIVRIDSGTFINNGELCDAYRRCGKNNESSCYKRDSIVGVFVDDNLNGYNSNGVQVEELQQKIIKYLGRNKKKTPISVEFIDVKGENRFYIHYTCPVSKFEEHIFPIYVNGHVIACLMLGQMARKDFKREETFMGYRDKMKFKNGSSIDFKNINIVSCNDDEWNEKAKAIVERILIFENRLKERIDHRNTRYISDAFEEIEKKFQNAVKGINIKDEDVFSQFTTALNTALSSIRQKFDDSNEGFIRMFAQPIEIDHTKLVPIGWTDENFDAIKKSTFSLEPLKDLEQQNRKEQVNIILQAASEDIKNKSNRRKDVFLPGWLAGNEVAYIVWKRHSDSLKRDENNFREYRKALKKFYSIAQECYSYIRSARMEELLERTIKISTHEAAHFILPAIDAVENNLKFLPQDMVLSGYSKRYYRQRDSFYKYKKEVVELLEQIEIINSESSLILLSELKIDKKRVKAKNFLSGLQFLLRNSANDSHKSIVLNQVDDDGFVKGDKKYFNYALYNLLDNAIKYGYEGSKIYINMEVSRVKRKLNIEVISYGIGIPDKENDRVYSLFQRGMEASKTTRGTGIGMFIVRKVCKAHGGDVSHTSEKISDYNIPVLFNYKNRKNLARNCSDDEIEKFDEEISKLSSKGIEQEVVNDKSFVKYTNVFTNRINEATYRNTFKITIPLN